MSFTLWRPLGQYMWTSVHLFLTISKNCSVRKDISIIFLTKKEMVSAIFCIFHSLFFYLLQGTVKKIKVKKPDLCHFYYLPGEKIERCSLRTCGFASIPLFLMFDKCFTRLWFEGIHTEVPPFPSNSKPTGQARYSTPVSCICRMKPVVSWHRVATSTPIKDLLCILK